MIIKELVNAGKEIKHRLREFEESGTPSHAEYALLKRKLDALNELQKYVVSGNWTQSASREKFVFFASNKFDYKLTAKQFHTSRESLDVFVFRQDKRLVKIIGEALHLIYADRIEEGLSSFYANAGIISAKEFDYRISAAEEGSDI